MSLWIRSQDKESLLECKTFTVGDKIQYTPKEHVEFDVFCENGILGFYSTKEKALKVLDMIQSFINNELIRDYMVFQMPQDDEVK